MKYRSRQEIEDYILSPYACKSHNTKGRKIYEEQEQLRTDFQKDRDRIIHSKAFRRLKHKTQVFIIPEGDHYRTRLSHTLEVSQIARTIARGLALNEDLTEAIALGHDLGHTPFGHAGERVLDELRKALGGFTHNQQSCRVVEVLEGKTAAGLNLTVEVIDGIANHTGNKQPMTLEGQIVKTADRIAYLNHDIDDAIRGKILSAEQLPISIIKTLGKSHSQRITTMVKDMIENSKNQTEIKLSSEIEMAMNELRHFLFESVYLSSAAKKEENKAKNIVAEVYKYYLNNSIKLAEDYNNYYHQETEHEQKVCDFVAGMTDKYIISLYKKIVIPEPWLVM